MEESNVTNNDIEKIDDESSGSQNETSVDTVEYPAKFKLAMIVVALMLSMFLVSKTFDSSPARCLLTLTTTGIS
jgi:hypothetical protein